MDIQQKQIWSIEQEIVLRTLAESVARPGCRFLEIGSWCGDSTVIFAKVAQKNSGYLFCVDWWKGNPNTELEEIASKKDIFSIFWNRICHEGFEDVIVPIRARSDVASGVLKNQVFDLVFIDGDHRYESVLRDIQSYAPLVNKNNGILCGHDCEERIYDFEMSFLESGKDIDCYEGVHCGVILAVGSTFKDYSINHGIWSVRASIQGSGWEATGLIIIKDQQKYEEYKKALDVEPDKDVKCNILIQLGNLYSQQQRFNEAEEELNKALSLEPGRNTKTNALIHLANLYSQQERYREAEKELKEALSLEPPDRNMKANILITFANIYSQQQRYTEAEDRLKEALSLEPPDRNMKANILITFANIYSQQQRYTEAEDRLKEALSLEPPDRNMKANILITFANIYSQQQRYTEAEDRLKEALSLEPPDRNMKANILITFANIYSQQQRYTKAEDRLKEALSLEPKDENTIASIYYTLGSNYEREGALGKAKEKFEIVIKLAEETSSFVKNRFAGGAHFHLGNIYQKMRDEERTKHHFEGCLRFIPDHRKAKENLEDSIKW